MVPFSLNTETWAALAAAATSVGSAEVGVDTELGVLRGGGVPRFPFPRPAVEVSDRLLSWVVVSPGRVRMDGERRPVTLDPVLKYQI